MGIERVQPLRDHLISRGCNPDDYNVILDEEDNVATFLIYTLTGKLVGFQQYRPGREKNVAKARAIAGDKLDLRDLCYYTFMREKEFQIWGFDRFDWKRGPIYVVEGIFDAVKLHNAGYNAVAVFGNSPVWLPAFREAMPHELIAVCDWDEPKNPNATPAGLWLSYYTDRYMVCPPGKDPGDMTVQELEEFLQHVNK